uniref:Uncharacterized protein n=1 Tax=viral metagenome TaxID=1070528 RepID=A0A6C0CSG5_9ZZZZ
MESSHETGYYKWKDMSGIPTTLQYHMSTEPQQETNVLASDYAPKSLPNDGSGIPLSLQYHMKHPPVSESTQPHLDYIDSEIDFVRHHADSYYIRGINVNLQVSEDYKLFFSKKNFDLIVSRLEQEYSLELSKHIYEDYVTNTSSYRMDILNSMLAVYDKYPCVYAFLMDMVMSELKPKFRLLQLEKNRYHRNIVENQTTRFLHLDRRAPLISKRRESLSFADALFGKNDKNVNQFAMFRTG